MILTTYKNKKNILKITTATALSALLTGCFSFIQPPQSHTGTDGDDVMDGTNGLDTFFSSLGADRIDGLYEGLFFNQHDVVDYSGSNAGVIVHLDGTTGQGGHGEGDVLKNIHDLIGSAFADTLNGDDNVNVLNGGGGNDNLNGGGNGDYLMGGAGADSLDGGNGSDYSDYSSSGAAVTVNLATNVNSGGDAQGDMLTSIENIIGSNFDDDLTGDANDNRIMGGKGADKIDGAGGRDTVDYSSSSALVNVNLKTGTGTLGDAQGDVYSAIENAEGSAYGDIIRGDDNANTLVGGKGNDQIFGEGGNDSVRGGQGNDEVYGQDGNDEVFGGSGNDLLYGGANNDTLYVGIGDDKLYGGSGTDEVDIFGADMQKIEFSVFKDDNMIQLSFVGGDGGTGVDLLNSIEQVASTFDGTIDIKNIWSDLSFADRFQFNNEADFLSWLGDDAGYNYEGL